MKSLALTAALLALSTACAYAQLPERDPVVLGYKLAKEFCGSCHALGKRGRSRHSDAPPFRTLGRTFDLDGFARVLASGLASGHPDMPQFKFSIQDARDLRDYLRTIQE